MEHLEVGIVLLVEALAAFGEGGDELSILHVASFSPLDILMQDFIISYLPNAIILNLLLDLRILLHQSHPTPKRLHQELPLLKNHLVLL